MARVLVTGSTGMLGRQLVLRLIKRGYDVRVLARDDANVVAGAETIRGDVRTGQGLGDAVQGVGTVIHAATSPRRRARQTEVFGTENVLRAAEQSGAHLIYVSIVGVDRSRFPYYKAKWEAEQRVESSSARWTIQRATQFHNLLDLLLGYPVFITTPHLAFQVVDAAEVAARVTDLVDSGPCGRAPDFGGPEVLPIDQLARVRREITARRSARLLPVPRLGPIRDFDAGYHLCPDQRAGRITWHDWLHTRQAPPRLG